MPSCHRHYFLFHPPIFKPYSRTKMKLQTIHSIAVSIITICLTQQATAASGRIHASSNRRAGIWEKDTTKSLSRPDNTKVKRTFAARHQDTSHHVVLNASSYYLSNHSVTKVGRGGGVDNNKRCIHPLAFTSIMAFLAGCSDILCIRRFQCYAAMMTGNIVSMSIALAEQNWEEVFWKLSLIGSYFVGTISARSTEWMCQRRTSLHGKVTRPRKVIAPVIFATFAIADRLTRVSPVGSISEKQKWNVAIPILALGYGMVYASANQALNGTITNLLTGHVTRVGSAVSDRFFSGERKWNNGASVSLCILGSFILGGMFGTVFEDVLKFMPLQSGQDSPVFTVMGIVYAVVLTLF